MNPGETFPVVGKHGCQSFVESHATLRNWPVRFAMMVILYYAISVVTLPFADDVWFGEAPLLAVLQLPKMYVNSTIQGALIAMLPSVGWESGSVSPDRMLTDSWALGATVVIPPLIVICALMLIRSSPRRRLLVGLVVVIAAMDAAVTCWFDSTSRLSLF